MFLVNEIVVNSTTHAYKIYIGENIRFNLKQYLSKEYSSIMVVTDDLVAKLYVSDIIGNFKKERIFHEIIPAGEQSKSIANYYNLQTKAIKNELDRKSLIIALGGGVVGDLAGFVAATYMRGIDYIQIPTTILAHDSSVGGKVAINHELGKNLIGSFYSPLAVIYDVNTLQTLGESEVRSGYAELVKEALIADKTFFNMLMETNLSDLSSEQLVEQLRAGIKIKAAIVESDEKEAGIRKYLNLGHTLGHALEAELGYGVLTHGEAVAIGLLFALRVSEQTFSIELPYEPLLNWLQKNGYPLNLPPVKREALIDKMKSDKKSTNKTVQMVLLENISEPIVMEINDTDLHQYLKSFIEELV